MILKSPLAHVRGLGSAKKGMQHWWAQRITGVVLVPLWLWFIISLTGLVGADYKTTVEWLSLPGRSALMLLLIIALFYHAQLGLQVVIEDYIHNETMKITALVASQMIMILLALVAIVSIIKISLGGV